MVKRRLDFNRNQDLFDNTPLQSAMGFEQNSGINHQSAIFITCHCPAITITGQAIEKIILDSEDFPSPQQSCPDCGIKMLFQITVESERIQLSRAVEFMIETNRAGRLLTRQVNIIRTW